MPVQKMPSLQYREQQQLPDALAKWSHEYESTLTLKYPLHRACRDGDLNALSRLLSSRSPQPDVLFTALDPFCGWTPAIWAAFYGQVECLKRVICAGPALNARSSSGMTALHAAALGNKPGCIFWLLKMGAAMQVTDAQGETVLHKAARSKAYDCTGLLAVCGADYSARNNDGLTAAQLLEVLHNQGIDAPDNKISINPQLPPALHPHISSNGYYGYQSVHKNNNTDDTMDSEDSPPTIHCECQTPNCNGDHSPSNGHTNGHFCESNVNGFAETNGRKRSMQESTPYLNGDGVKKMRHEEPAVAAVQAPPAVPAPPPPTVTPATPAVRRCEIVYPRCMMGHYM
ncbi:hypothetical protein B566_EDAN010133 [Ephemera danica]|nr:hypothetical protein B566_EDAN010133 [Ephemera danica]